MSKDVQKVLSEFFSFESKKSVPVKGVEGGMMDTFLLLDKIKSIDVLDKQ